ncbi:hypothetical protein ACFB49_45440 [Sphingomonas sp. DBB INV C78]|uniref:ComEC/Rec2 family competence protein n=1 Tax=Sphingomonas sp. DBB INV C78 TaxID=3349434 RepID=UPI0036D35CAC
MRIASALTLAALLGAFPLFAQTAPLPEEAPYLDDQGEEVFGPNYQPASPTDSGTPLLVGQPAGGAVVDQAVEAMNQQEAARTIQPEAASPEASRSPQPMPFPLLRSVRETANMPRWRSRPAASRSHPGPAAAPAALDQEMIVHFVYVGQGAGAIVEFPCGVTVIDTGGEYRSGDNGGKMFTAYLESFFAARPALNRTIDVLFTSHPHKDHLFGLSLMGFGDAAGAFKIRNIVDNGQTGTEGSLAAQTKAREAARAAGANYSAVEFANQTSATGSTNAVIDPISCPTIDPKITAFWGSRNDALVGASAAEARRYISPNNHSVVVRIDFGKASLLFMGDLQQEGIDDMLTEYEDNLSAFDVDVLHVSHHGAENGMSDRLIEVTSPRIAILSMGDRSSTAASTAFDHGHPRLSTIALMQKQPEIVSSRRSPKTFWGAEKEETPFKDVVIRRAIYGTGWEGTLRLKAKADGTYRFVKP